MAKRDSNKYPKGLNATRVRAIIDHYDGQPESAAIAEADAAWENSRTTMVRVPNEVLKDVREIIESHGKSRKRLTTPVVKKPRSTASRTKAKKSA